MPAGNMAQTLSTKSSRRISHNYEAFSKSRDEDVLSRQLNTVNAGLHVCITILVKKDMQSHSCGEGTHHAQTVLVENPPMIINAYMSDRSGYALN